MVPSTSGRFSRRLRRLQTSVDMTDKCVSARQSNEFSSNHSPASLCPIPWTLFLSRHLASESHRMVRQAEAKSPSCAKATQRRTSKSFTRVRSPYRSSYATCFTFGFVIPGYLLVDSQVMLMEQKQIVPADSVVAEMHITSTARRLHCCQHLGLAISCGACFTIFYIG